MDNSIFCKIYTSKFQSIIVQENISTEFLFVVAKLSFYNQISSLMIYLPMIQRQVGYMGGKQMQVGRWKNIVEEIHRKSERVQLNIFICAKKCYDLFSENLSMQSNTARSETEDPPALNFQFRYVCGTFTLYFD